MKTPKQEKDHGDSAKIGIQVSGISNSELGTASEIVTSLLGANAVGDASPLTALLNSPVKPSLMGSPGALGASFDVDEIDAMLDSVEREVATVDKVL